ncbi:MAG: L,D-transpeptidase family protein [Sphingomonadales bacterium]
MILRTIAIWLLLALCGSAAFVQGLPDNAPMHAVAAALRPGQFRWSTGDVGGRPDVVVSLVLQRVYVYRTGALVGVAAVSTGRLGKTTPSGEFSILQKARWHRSNLYSNAPMPFMQRLTWDGIALHAGHNPGYPASHGCIRLPPAFARDLFTIVPIGARVTITDYPAELPVRLEVEDFGIGLGEPRLEYAPDAFF